MKIQAYALFNEQEGGPLTGCYHDKKAINLEMAKWPDYTRVTFKSYSWIWNAFLELEEFNSIRNDRLLISPHTKCTGTPCYNHIRVEYRMIDPKADRKPDFVNPINFSVWNSVGVLLNAFDGNALCKITFCRYSVFADAKIPVHLLKHVNAFSLLLKEEKFRKRFRIYAIGEHQGDKNDIHAPHRILFTDTKIWAEIPGD